MEAALDDYRVRMRESDRTERGDNDELTRHGRTVHHFDPATGLLTATDEWRDDTTRAVTTLEYNVTTGQLIAKKKPVQQETAGGSGNRTTYSYDDHRLFVVQTINELGHVVETEFDIATGVKILQRGPNSITGDITEPQTQVWIIDGLGRIVQHQVSVENNAADPLTLETVERFTYEDSEFVDAGEPVRIIQHQRRDFGIDEWITQEKSVDGLGRLLTERVELDGVTDAITTYEYDFRGNLAARESPDPRVDDGSRVRYIYKYDGINRVIRFVRPDDTGVAISYTGFTKTVEEITTDGSSGSKRLAVADVFGRLVELHEFYPESSNGQAVAITKYAYDANDNLVHVVDADGNETAMVHDFTGNRESITRGERVWRYSYDLNGNILTETMPGAEQVTAATAAETFTTNYSYDDLDRIVSLRFAKLFQSPSTSESEASSPETIVTRSSTSTTRTRTVSVAYLASNYPSAQYAMTITCAAISL